MKKMRRINLNEKVLGYGDVGNQWFRSTSKDSKWTSNWFGYIDDWVGYFDVVGDRMLINDKKANLGIQMIFEI